MVQICRREQAGTTLARRGWAFALPVTGVAFRGHSPDMDPEPLTADAFPLSGLKPVIMHFTITRYPWQVFVHMQQ